MYTFCLLLAIKPTPSQQSLFLDPATGIFQAGEVRMNSSQSKGGNGEGTAVMNGALIFQKTPIYPLLPSVLCRAGCQ